MQKIGAYTERATEQGEWRAGDPASNVRATPMLAAYFNMLQREVCNVVTGAGMGLDSLDDGQLLQAIQAMIGAAGYLPRLPAIPEAYVADEIYVSGFGELVWVETAFFVGYRGPYCGRPVFSHTAVPLPREVDAVGGLLPKAQYAGLWGYAQEENLVYSDTVWSANKGSHWFADVSETNFRAPDLRNMFLRFTGTDVDTANARPLGSNQIDTLRLNAGLEWHTQNWTNDAPSPNVGTGAVFRDGYIGGQIIAAGGVETRAINVALHPRILL